MTINDKYYLRTEQLKEVDITEYISDAYNNYVSLNISQASDVLGTIFEYQVLIIKHNNGKKHTYRLEIIRFYEGRLEEVGFNLLLLRLTGVD